MGWLIAGLVLLGVLLLCIAGFGAAVFCEGLWRHPVFDRNYDAARDADKPLPAFHTEYRKRAYPWNRWWNTQPLERRELRTADGLTLRGGLLRAETPCGRTALVVHGHLCCAGEIGFLSKMYHDAGYDVLAVDQRAHGASEGRFIGMGWLEGKDIAAWARQLAAELPGQPLVLHGCSMGAATVMNASAEPLPPEALCAVEDCGFTTAAAAFLVELRRGYPALPFKRAALWVADRLCRIFAGYSLYGADCRRSVSRARLPMLFLQGTGDALVPWEMARELCALHPGEKDLVFFGGAAHSVSYFNDTPKYERAVFGFIAHALAARGGRTAPAAAEAASPNA